MSFPVLSVSTITAPCKRFALVVMQRTHVGQGPERIIDHGGVYNCRRSSANSSVWSEHAWGNATDLIPTPGEDQAAKRRAIAEAAVRQATKRTIANRGRKVPIAHVIDHDARRIWSVGVGWHAYGGSLGNHVHVDFLPYRTGVPPCAA